MSHDSPAMIRSSCSSRRYSPYSRAWGPNSAHPLPLPLPLPSGPLYGHDGERSSSDSSLSPAPVYSPSLHPITSSVTGYPAVPPSLNSQPIYVTQPSTSTSQLERSYQAYSFPQPPAPLAQVPCSQRPYVAPPTAKTPYSAPMRSLPNFPPPHAERPSITIHQPEDSTYQNYLIQPYPLHATQPVQTLTQQNQRYYGDGMFKYSRDFSVTNSMFIDNTITSDNFMKDLLQHTIIGAEFDSSDRHPPPRCHPGTRLAIIERCKIFTVQCDGKEKMRWVVGPAGVGKTAIMQMVAEDIPADASVFFSVNGRQDGTKIFLTIAYQLAAKYEPYRHFIRNEISRDPSLLRKSLPAQFRNFVVDPFIHQHLFHPSQRFLVVIDGLDECDNPRTQRELLGLISYFCIKYPASPIAWIVASRPEPHIASFFDDARVVPTYTKAEIKIDSDGACEDVQRYLRDELNKIKLASPILRHKREWPSELEFTKIATAAGGLFAYASTVVRYIGDPHYRNPVAQLQYLLETIDGSLIDDACGRAHPMAQLDALYTRILSSIPAHVMIDTRKLLLSMSFWYPWDGSHFRTLCNEMGLSEAIAYGAISYLHAVLMVPAPDNADDEPLEYFHKSFIDFLRDFNRSGFSPDFDDEARQLESQAALRIAEQVPDNSDIDSGEVIKCYDWGYVKAGPNICDNISLSWPADERYRISDDQLRRKMYQDSIPKVCAGLIALRSKVHYRSTYFHILTTRFTWLGVFFPAISVGELAFEKFRSELAELGKLKQIPLWTLDYAAICGLIEIRFKSPIGLDAEHFDPWNPSCQHGKVDVDGSPEQWQHWETRFKRFLGDPGDDVVHTRIPRFSIEVVKASHRESLLPYSGSRCLSCTRRFARHYLNNPDQLATVFVDSTGLSRVEFSLVDPEDGVSEWVYRFLHSGRPSCSFNV